MSANLIVDTNSYVDVPTAQAYFDNRLYADSWINATADDKAKALIMASQKIDRLPVKGVKAKYQQTMQFPRALYSDYRYSQYVIPAPMYFSDGWYVEKSVTDNVKNAVCEEALALLKGEAKRVELQRQGVRDVTIGSLQETYVGSPKKLLSQEAEEFLLPYLVGSASIC